MRKQITTLIGLGIIMTTQISADTPDKLDNPEALRKDMPMLKDQPHWTEFATAEEIKLYDGPETEWQTVPKDQYDFTGFNNKILGGKLPEPGAHPRVLFSPEDLPEIKKRFMGTKEQIIAGHIFETQLWDPKADDYQWYSKLASGELAGLEFEDPEKGPNGNHNFKGIRSRIYITHTPHIPRILASAAAYALFTGDEKRSKELATVIANYYKLREPIVDAQNERGTKEYVEKYKRKEVELVPWPNDLWRGMHLICGAENVGLAYDYTANWMTEDQKKIMRRYISKSTKGKRAYGQNGPVRWRDTNWVGWDLTLPLTALAIEGEDGFDPELLDVAETTVDGYMTYGISPYGTILETNGKNGAGFDYAIKTAIALARRGKTNFFGHPHLKKLSASQIQQIAPDGDWNVNNGTYGCSRFRNGGWLATAYPDDLNNIWMLYEGHDKQPEDLEEFKFRLTAPAKEVKAKGLQPVGRVRPDIIFEKWLPIPDKKHQGKEAWEREYLKLPLDFEDPHHGQFCTRSGNDKDALFMMIEARPDLYVGGHQHHDAGHFYIAADGQQWAVENDHGKRSSMFHNVVLIDGKGQGDVQHCAPSKVEWLGADINDQAAFAKMNIKRGYDFIWTTPMHYSWMHDERKAYKWRPETDAEIVKIFKGTQNYKARVWMHSYWEQNWGPTMKAEYNPVEYAFRTAGMVKGKNPYLVIVDDIKKDDKEHLYEWQMQVPKEARLVDLSAGIKALVIGDKRHDSEPMLLICPMAVGSQDAVPCLETFEVADGKKKISAQRVVVKYSGQEAHFRILLIPLKGEKAKPSLTYENDKAKIAWQTGKRLDEIDFTKQKDGRTTIVIKQDGKEIANVR